MNFTLDQATFSKSLQNVSRFVASRSQLPILSNILIETGNSQVKLTATNLELTIQETLPALVNTPGKITVPAGELTEFVNYLSPGKVTLSLTENNLLQLDSQNQSATFATQLANDFPPLPVFDENNTVELPLLQLSNTLDQVIFAAATEDTRPILTAILTKLNPEDISLVATDGFRLSKSTTTLDKPIFNIEQSLLIPAKSFSEVLKLSKSQKNIKLAFDIQTSQMCFYLENLVLVSRLLQGDYPDYNRILPKSTETTVTLDKQEFVQAIKSASVFAKTSANVVKFKVGTASVQILANSPQVGKNQSEVEAKIEGKPLEIAFNYRFLLEFLGICKGSTVTIGLNESLTPALFKDLDSQNLVHVIMPVRLQD